MDTVNMDIGNLKQHFDSLSDDEKAIRILTFSHILNGSQPTITELASESGLDELKVQRCIAILCQHGTMTLDSNNNISGCHGLSLTTTRHRLNINGQQLFTWCAADAVGIAGVLKMDATIISKCAFCEMDLEIRLENGNVQQVSENNIRVWVVEADLCKSIVACACPQMNFYCSEHHFAKANIASQGRLLTLEQTIETGRIWWSDVSHLSEQSSCCNVNPKSKANNIESLGNFVCYCNKVSEDDIERAVINGADTVEKVIIATGAMQSSNCAVNNPKGVCCHSDIIEVCKKFDVHNLRKG